MNIIHNSFIFVIFFFFLGIVSSEYSNIIRKRVTLAETEQGLGSGQHSFTFTITRTIPQNKREDPWPTNPEPTSPNGPKGPIKEGPESTEVTSNPDDQTSIEPSPSPKDTEVIANPGDQIEPTDAPIEGDPLDPIDPCATCLVLDGIVSPLFTFQVAVSHRFSELALILTSPSEITSILVRGNGGTYSNLFNGTLFEDSAQFSAAEYPFTGNGVVSPLKPLTPLSEFIGGDHFGEWTFTVEDNNNNRETPTLYWFELVIQGHFLSFFFFFFLFLQKIN